MNQKIIVESIRGVWEIRGLVDKGIQEKNNSYIIETKEKMEELNTLFNEDEFTLKSCTLLGVDRCFSEDFFINRQRNQDARLRSLKHLNDNMNAIYGKYVNNEKVSIKFSEEEIVSILEWLWLLRAMWDDLLDKVSIRKIDELEARNIYKLIIKDLKNLERMRPAYNIGDDIAYISEIKKIIDEVEKTKSQIYRAEIDEKDIHDYIKNF